MTELTEQSGWPSYPTAVLESTREAEHIGSIIAEIVRPVMEAMGKVLENNTNAMEEVAAALAVQNDRLAALEKQIRLQTPVTGKQVGYLNDAIRQRSRELLDKRDIDDKKAVTKLGNAIRKSVLARYGIDSLRETPKHEYPVAMQQIGMWSDALTVRDIVKEARERAELAGLSAGADGTQTPSRLDD